MSCIVWSKDERLLNACACHEGNFKLIGIDHVSMNPQSNLYSSILVPCDVNVLQYESVIHDNTYSKDVHV